VTLGSGGTGSSERTFVRPLVAGGERQAVAGVLDDQVAIHGGDGADHHTQAIT
jgi:hypothetical protein